MTRFTAPTRKQAAGKPRKVTREKAPVQEQEYLGLCTTCIHTKTCTFRRDVSQAVLECDEFDIGKTIAPETKYVPAADESKTKAKTEFKGLCVNCDIRHECAFPRPAEGIWHCEEYV